MPILGTQRWASLESDVRHDFSSLILYCSLGNGDMVLTILMSGSTCTPTRVHRALRFYYSLLRIVGHWECGFRQPDTMQLPLQTKIRADARLYCKKAVPLGTQDKNDYTNPFIDYHLLSTIRLMQQATTSDQSNQASNN